MVFMVETVVVVHLLLPPLRYFPVVAVAELVWVVKPHLLKLIVKVAGFVI